MIPLLAHVEHDHPPVYVDLGGGEPDALGGVHGLQHVVDQPSHRIIHDLDGLGGFPETGIRVLQNDELAHGSYGMNIVFLAGNCC